MKFIYAIVVIFGVGVVVLYLILLAVAIIHNEFISRRLGRKNRD